MRRTLLTMSSSKRSATEKGPSGRPYHHGDLRRAILTAALDVIAADGPSGLSLRDLARRAGVSHAAPAHHFKDRAGLLTAIAAWYASFAQVINSTFARTVAPIGPLSH